MTMNMSDLIDRIKLSEVGIYCMALPIDDPDGLLVKIIKKTTLKVYSVIFPQPRDIIVPYKTVYDSYRSSDTLEGKKPYCSIMLDIPEHEEIISIERVEPARGFSTSYIESTNPVYGGIYTPLQQMLLSNVENNIARNMVQSISWDFIDPRELRIFYGYCGDIYVEYNKLHDLSLSSVPLSREESFFELATLDCKKSLYEVIKHYNEVETAHGRVAMKIDSWQNADQERKEIIREWREIGHLDGRSVYWA